jgi:alpha-galactosidase
MATISQTSLDILMNKEIIALNQDPLGAAAALVRRYSQEQYDVWAGPLSGDRMVLAVSNWNTASTSVTVNLASVLNVASADARDVWAKADTKINGTYTATLAGHHLKILVLSNIVKSTTAEKSVGYHLATAAQLSGSAKTQSCSSSQCLPGNKKVAMGSSGRVTFSNVSGGTHGGKKVFGVDFIQYDVALGSAWADGASVRPMAVQVNDGTTKTWQWHIAGGSWYETGRLNIELEGLRAGTNNTVVFSTSTAGPDLVGFEVFELVSFTPVTLVVMTVTNQRIRHKYSLHR